MVRDPDPDWPRRPIMVIDDDLAWIKLMQQSLQVMGWRQVRGLSDPRRAVPLAREFKPSLVLLDLIMAERDGHDVLREFHEELPHIPVVMLTGVDRVDEAVACMRMGAVDYLTKPIRRDELGRALHAALDQSAQPRAPADDHDQEVTDALKSMKSLPALKEAPQLLIEEALARSNGVVKEAAAMLGVTPQAICNRRRRSTVE